VHSLICWCGIATAAAAVPALPRPLRKLLVTYVAAAVADVPPLLVAFWLDDGHAATTHPAAQQHENSQFDWLTGKC
jgi:hypothetical protein